MRKSIPIGSATPNGSGVNQAALRCLRQLKADADSNQLYSLQLAEWLLTNHPDEIPGVGSDVAWEVLMQLQMMYGWRQESAMNCLLDEEGGFSLQGKALDSADPQDLATVLVENLYDTLVSSGAMWFPTTE